MGPYPGIAGSVVLVRIAVLGAKTDACGVSGNGLWKLALLELDGPGEVGFFDTALSSMDIPELV
jgi:hypothetical protein